jgi:hypothetical protein
MTRSSLSVSLVLAATVLVAACGGDDDGSDSAKGSDAAAVVEGYVAAYNAQDIDGVMTFFADDAVILASAERVGGAERIEGAAAIRASTLEGFSVHAPGGEAYSISNLVVTGNAVAWDHLFKGIAHTCIGTGNEAIVEDSKIVVWTFASISCE